MVDSSVLNSKAVEFLAMLAKTGREDAHAFLVTDKQGKARYSQVLRFPSETDLATHLSSERPVGIYLMDGKTVRAAVLDLDDHDGLAGPELIKAAASKLCDALRMNGMRPIVFRSGGGRGMHIWMMWAGPQLARDVRRVLEGVLAAAELRNGTTGVAHGTVEIFPKQDEVGARGFGNLIALPLTRASVAVSGSDFTPISTEAFEAPSNDNLYSLPAQVAAQSRGTATRTHQISVEDKKLQAALGAIPSDDYDDWIRIGIILRSEFGGAGFDAWNDWSKRSDKYPGEEQIAQRWEGLPDTATIGLGSLFYMAQQRAPKPQAESYASHVISARALGDKDIPPRSYIVEPFLPERGLVMIWAERGIGKTWVSLCLALAIAQGDDFLTYETTGSYNVFYIDGEMPLAELKERLKQLSPVLPDNLFILSSETLALQGEQLNIADCAHRARLEQTLTDVGQGGHALKVVILDNLSSLSSGVDENSNSEQDDTLLWLIRLRHMGYTVVLVHHAGKGGQQRGASRREDILDTSIKLEAPKDEEGIDRAGGATFILSFTKTRGKTPVPDKLVLYLRENVNGQLEFIFQKSVAISPYLQTLRVLATGIPSSSGLIRPVRNQTELVELRKVSKGTISKHMTKLRDQQMVIEGPNGLMLMPRGVTLATESLGIEVPAALRWAPAMQEEIPF